MNIFADHYEVNLYLNGKLIHTETISVYLGLIEQAVKSLNITYDKYTVDYISSED